MRCRVWIFIALGLVPISRADEALFRYEGDVLPYDPASGWLVFNSCESPCSEAVEDGHFVLHWPVNQNLAHYNLWIAQPPHLPPPTLWVEWSFASNHARGMFFDSCDADFVIKFGGVFEVVFMYGDFASSYLGNHAIGGLTLSELHTYRFESFNGIQYSVSVDGKPFIIETDPDPPNGYHALQMAGSGGCIGDWIPNMVNEWDFIRYGTISYGEAVVDSDPPMGDVCAIDYPNRTSFTVTYDSPNYVYVDEISVSVEDYAGVAQVAPMDYPMVLQTRRLDNGPPEVVEIVLDKPIPHAAVTTFTLTDGVATNIIAYTLSPADADGDGLATLADFAHFQNCFKPGAASPFCRTFDLSRNGSIDLTDHLLAQPFLTNP